MKYIPGAYIEKNSEYIGTPCKINHPPVVGIPSSGIGLARIKLNTVNTKKMIINERIIFVFSEEKILPSKDSAMEHFMFQEVKKVFWRGSFV